jgi:hypothetical protein
MGWTTGNRSDWWTSSRKKQCNGGVHPHCDGKSPEAIEDKGVAGVHCASRVRRESLEIKELSDGDTERDEAKKRDLGVRPGWSLANTWKDSMPVRIG